MNPDDKSKRPCIHPDCKGTQTRIQFEVGWWYWIWKCDENNEHRNLEFKEEK